MKFRHLQGIEVKSVFSPDKSFRYRLELHRAKPVDAGRVVCFIMQNPSRADENESDKTVQFIEKRLLTGGTGPIGNVNTVIVVNQFAKVQTCGFSGTYDDVGKDNDRHVRKALQEAQIAVIAWGKTNEHVERQLRVLYLIANSSLSEVYLLPTHPSRASGLSKLTLLDFKG